MAHCPECGSTFGHLDSCISKKDYSSNCNHEWVHLRKEDNVEIGYRKFAEQDVFFCKKCLTINRIRTPIPEKEKRYW